MTRCIYVLYGGKSAEHEVSIRSARTVLNNLDLDKYEVYPVYITKKGAFIPHPRCEKKVESVEDLMGTTEGSPAATIGEFLTTHYTSSAKTLFIPCIHGTTGEDGVIQGFLEMLDVPYVGSGVLSSAVCMDKGFCNQLMGNAGIPQAKYYVLKKHDFLCPDFDPERIEKATGYPMFVKPSANGSSVGVSRARNREQLMASLKHAFVYDNKVVVEEEVVGQEVEISVIGNRELFASLPGGYVSSAEVFDYNAKYHDASTVAMAPMDLNEDTVHRLRELAKKAYAACDCEGLARVDIFVRASDGNLLVNEINTFPGMTPTSLYARLLEVTDGTTYPQMLERLMDLAIDSYKEKQLSIDVKR